MSTKQVKHGRNLLFTKALFMVLEEIRWARLLCISDGVLQAFEASSHEGQQSPNFSIVYIEQVCSLWRTPEQDWGLYF